MSGTNAGLLAVGAVLTCFGALLSTRTCHCTCTQSDELLSLVRSQLDRCGPSQLAPYIPASQGAHPQWAGLALVGTLAVSCACLGIYRQQRGRATETGPELATDIAPSPNVQGPRRLPQRASSSR